MKAIMKINSFIDGTLTLSIGDIGVRSAIQNVVDICHNRHGGYIKLDMTVPYKQRTLPENNLYWELCTQYAKFLGETKDNVSMGVKYRAMEEGLWRGKVIPFTNVMIPDSSATADTKEFAVLIDVLKRIAAEDGFYFEDL